MNINRNNCLIYLIKKMRSKISLYNPSINSIEKKNVIQCLRDNWISSKGKFVNQFEKSFKKI